MGSKGGGGSSNSSFQASSSTYSPDPLARKYYEQILGGAENLASKPYQPYQSQMVAGFTPDQMQAFEATRQAQGIANPYINAATNLNAQAVNLADPRNYNQQTLSQYMNPYNAAVTQATMANLEQLQKSQQNELTSKAVRAGALGGDRTGIARAALAGQQNLANAQTLAQLQSQGFDRATAQYNAQQQQAINAAQQASYNLGQLGNQAQQTALTGIQALLGTGAQQQQLGQQQLTNAFQQFQQAQAYPYQQLAFQAGIAAGLGPNLGGTTNSIGFGSGNQQTQSGGGASQAMGGISSIMSMLPAMFSDEDDKTDIKYLGKDESGEKMYAYRYKGDPKSYPKVVGPMAQDIEEHDPERVREVGGHKIVEGFGHLKPSEREHFDAGGMAAGGNTVQAGGLGALANGTQPNASTTQAALDPGLGQFLQGIYDPRTAYQAAKAKWVNQPQEFGEQRYQPDTFQIPQQLMQDGGDSYPYSPSNNEPRRDGGRVGFADGGDTGSFFDLIKRTGAGGPMADAPGNYIAPAQQVGLGKIIPVAKDIAEQKTGQAASHMMSELGSKGGGGGGGGGGGAPKLPEMKMPKQKKPTVPDFDPSKGAAPAGGAPSSSEPGPGPSAAPEADTVSPANKAAGQGGFDFAQHAEPMPDTSPVVEQLNAPMPEMAPPVNPEVPWLNMFGGFRKDGGRVGYADGGVPAGGGRAVIGSGGGFGDIVLGSSPSWSDLAGFGDIGKSQETLTGQNLLDKWNAGVWAKDPGEQLTPEQQGMPAMPDAKYYQTPQERMPGKIQSETVGEKNPGLDPFTLMMMGGKSGMNLGMATMIGNQVNAQQASEQQKALQEKRAKMLAEPRPVEGYFQKLGNQNINPRTGLYNMDYTGAYYGMPYKDGGRVAMQDGGNPPSYTPSQKDIDSWARTVLREAGNQGKEGMAAVAHVIKNRLESGKYGKTIHDVVTAPKQFSPWNRENIGTAADPRRVNPESPGYKKALEIVKGVMSGEVKSPVGGATHFANPDAVRAAYHGRIPQAWLRSMMADPKTVRVGEHIFNTMTAGAKQDGPRMALSNAPSQGSSLETPRRTPFDPSRPSLAFAVMPQRTMSPIAKPEPGFSPRAVETARAEPARVVAADTPQKGSVLNYINPKDPSGPLLNQPAVDPTKSSPRSPNIRIPSPETPARVPVAPQSSASPYADPQLAKQWEQRPQFGAKRGLSLSDLNPVQPARAAGEDKFPGDTVAQRMSDAEVMAAVGRGEKVQYDESGNAVRYVPATVTRQGFTPEVVATPRIDKGPAASAGDRPAWNPNASTPPVEPEHPLPRIDKGEPGPTDVRPGFHMPEYTFAPGVQEQSGIMTDFGSSARQGYMPGDVPYAVTMVGTPMSTEPFDRNIGFSEKAMGPEAPETASAQPKAEPSKASPETGAGGETAGGQKYWGDFRDVEPWKSDPIGLFFDELSGERPQASKPGTWSPGQSAGFDLSSIFGGAEQPATRAPTPRAPAVHEETNAGKTTPWHGPSELKPEQGPPMPEEMQREADKETEERRHHYVASAETPEGLDFTNLFAHGGTVRQHFAGGGEAYDDLDPLKALEQGLGGLGEGISEAVSGIGEGLGSLINPPVSRETSQATEGTEAPDFYTRWSENPLSQLLFNTGQALMAHPNANPLTALSTAIPHGVQGAMAAREAGQVREKAAAEQAAAQRFAEQATPRSAEPAPEETEGAPTEGGEEGAGRQPAATRETSAAPAGRSSAEIQHLLSEYQRIARLPAVGPQIAQKNQALSIIANNIKLLREEGKSEQGEIATTTDEFGQPIMYWKSGPKQGQIFHPTEETAPAEPTAPGGEGAPAHVDWTKDGEEFLKTLPIDIQDQVRQVAEGRADLPKGKYAQAIWRAAVRYSPGLDQSLYNTRKNLMKEYSSNTGMSAGAQMTAGNTAIGHAAELSDLVLKLNNYDQPLLNKPLNWVRDNYGQEAAQTLNAYRSLAKKYVDEQQAFYHGRGGGSAGERDEAARMFDPSLGPKTILAALKVDQEAMTSKVKELEERWNKIMNKGQSIPAENFDVLSENAKKGQALLTHNIAVAEGKAKPVRTGRTKDGRPVTKYSDGYIKYGE